MYQGKSKWRKKYALKNWQNCKLFVCLFWEIRKSCKKENKTLGQQKDGSVLERMVNTSTGWSAGHRKWTTSRSHPHSLCSNQGCVLSHPPSCLEALHTMSFTPRFPQVSAWIELSLRLKHHIPVTLGPCPLF